MQIEVTTLTGEIKSINFFTQLSETGELFTCGYYIGGNGFLHAMFAEGEEKERDAWLTENNYFDEETPDWASLHEFDGESFYYSEWTDADTDVIYDVNGNTYTNINGKYYEKNDSLQK